MVLASLPPGDSTRAGFVCAAAVQDSAHACNYPLGHSRCDFQDGVLPDQTVSQMIGNGASVCEAHCFRAVVLVLDLAGLFHHGPQVNPVHPLAKASSGRQHPMR